MTTDNPDLRAVIQEVREHARVSKAAYMDGTAKDFTEIADKLEALLTRTEAGADQRVRHSCETDMLSDCAGCAADAAPVADGIDPSELSSLRQRAGAWDAVAETCRAIDPDALAVYGPTGRESIVNFIKQFTHPQDASASGLKTALWLLRGCVEHMEHSTEQGRAAWENARDYIAAANEGGR